MYALRISETTNPIEEIAAQCEYKLRAAELLAVLRPALIAHVLAAPRGCWLDGHFGSLLPQGPLGQAFGYAIRQWRALTRYTESGILLPDNNLLERQMRPIAMGRKAYLFTASERGGMAAATMYSLVATCKLHRIEPFAYLKDVLGRIRNHRMDSLAELLSFNWSPAHA